MVEAEKCSRKLEVLDELDQLVKVCAGLEEATSALEGRLAPILSLEAEGQSKDAAPEIQICDLAGRIRKVRYVVIQAENRLRRLTSCLQV